MLLAFRLHILPKNTRRWNCAGQIEAHFVFPSVSFFLPLDFLATADFHWVELFTSVKLETGNVESKTGHAGNSQRSRWAVKGWNFNFAWTTVWQNKENGLAARVPSNSHFSYSTGSTLSLPPLRLPAHRSPWSCLLVVEEGHSTVWAQTSWFSAPLCSPGALSLQQQRSQKYVSYFKTEQLNASRVRSGEPSFVKPKSHGTLVTLFSFCPVVSQTGFGCPQRHQPFLPLSCIDRPEVKVLFSWYCEVNPCRVWGMNWGNTQKGKTHIMLLTMCRRQQIIQTLDGNYKEQINCTIHQPWISQTEIFMLPLQPFQASSCES